MASRRRSRSVFEEEEEDAAPSSGAEVPKRQRRDDSDEEELQNGDNEEADEADFTKYEEDEEDNHLSQINLRTPPNEYSPGAVVRVKLVNFVTYEKAVFYPGPNLNMIIGPNGTGKSSLVCALALGLGYPTNVLGRATKFSEYVTHGKNSAVIEIELQKLPNERQNHVIRLEITRENNNRRFFLQGKDTSQKNVQALVARLRIACDNLCQFLPQEKVAEFAGLSPVQLLHETLRAAAPEQMMTWQTQLKEVFKDHKMAKTRVETDADQLKNLQERQQGLQADVDRLKERENINNKIEDMKNARCCAEYNIARDRYQALKRKKKDAEKRLKALERSAGPALEAVNDKEEYRGRIDRVLEHRKRALRDSESAAEQASRAVEAVEEKVTETQNSIENERKAFGDKKTEIGKIRANINKQEAEHRNEPPPFDPVEWNRKIREKEHAMREMRTEIGETTERRDDVKVRGKEVVVDQKSLQRELEKLDSQEGQKASRLKSLNHEVYEAWEWLQGNLDKFGKEVFGPPMLTCSLNDERYSKHVESLLQRNDFLCFTCQDKKDHMALSEFLYKEKGLSVTIRTCLTDFESFKSPVSPAEASALGFDGFAIDFLEGPKPVLAMLCSEKKLHMAGVALNEVSREQFNALQNSERISSWATGDTFFRVVRRREYGPDAKTTSTRQIAPAVYWTDSPVDTSEKADLQRRLGEKAVQRRDLANEYKELDKVVTALLEKSDTLEAEVTQLKSEKSELQTVHTRWQTIPDQIETNKANLKRALATMQECKARVAQHERKRDQLIIEKAMAVLDHKDKISQIRDAYLDVQDAHLRLIEAASDVRGLKERNGDITRELDDKRQEIANYANDVQLERENAQRAQEKVSLIVSQGGEGDLERYEVMVQNKTLDEIDDEVNAEKAKLELIHAVNPTVLQQFEERAKKIADLTKEAEKWGRKLDRLDAQSKELMVKFEPQLERIVSKVNEAFGKNFERINCAGEVSLHKDEDFEQWAIEIRVKFRPNEELQLLNQHRQSGGERAVSTVFYIMALQSMAQAPFRVVDEINQGMDPRNERMVHERMVEIACKEHTSQYFLITPKLLTGLAYDDNMRILCIASGIHVPENGHKLDIDKLIRRQRAAKSGRVSA
ncbi:hypothetical protein PFICI_13927 [Pestalotiopsis fici W106-1]|uniref:Structural maintenance of chromosomes protein 5 n=1 Tax=Pestalotiopsis fici (strain W106-1 / CGMCC3.15140) TaxID=1229662 RepID=W3WML4_PESFW|nr:uncharacterized protein PFICI_13927 [Pestalotiopsis fici W106-1]ETS74061.1 hypothetical protein PFICI_13927 [Pestalotiopsis fici W106-1]